MYINVGGSAEGDDLVRALSCHGLIAGVVLTEGRWQVEVRSPREDARTFLADVGVALAAWSGGDPRGGRSADHDRRRA